MSGAGPPAAHPAGLAVSCRPASDRADPGGIAAGSCPRRARPAPGDRAKVSPSRRWQMTSEEQERELLRAQGEGHLTPGTPGSAPPPGAEPGRRRMGFGQRVFVALLLTVVTVPPAAAFYSYFSGAPLHLLAPARDKEDEGTPAASARSSVTLVAGQAHTLDVPEEVCAALGIRKGDRDAVAVAKAPTVMRP